MFFSVALVVCNVKDTSARIHFVLSSYLVLVLVFRIKGRSVGFFGYNDNLPLGMKVRKGLNKRFIRFNKVKLEVNNYFLEGRSREHIGFGIPGLEFTILPSYSIMRRMSNQSPVWWFCHRLSKWRE